MNKQILKLEDTHLLALIRGTKIAVNFGDIVVDIIPPLYEDGDRFKYAFEAGQEFQRQAEIYLDLASKK